MQKTAPRSPKLAAGFPWLLFFAVGGWMLSGLVFLILSPLYGSLASVSVVIALLFVLPGFMVIAALRFNVSSSPWGVMAASFGVGSGIVLALTFMVRLVGLPLSAVGQSLWLLELPLLVVLVVQWRRGTLLSFQLSTRSRRAMQADWILLALLGLVVGVYVLDIQWAIPLGGPTDWPKYLNYTSWVLSHPEVPSPQMPPIHLQWYASFRVWWSVLAVVTDLVKTDTSVLDVFWRFVPPTLIAFSMLAIYSLACELFDRPGVWIASIFVQIAYLFGGLPSAVRGHNEWVSYSVLYTVSEDNVLLSFVLIPIFSFLVIRFLRDRQLNALLPIGLASIGAVFTHPLGFPFVMIIAGAYSLLDWLTRRSQKVTPYIALGIMLIPLVIFPLYQRLSRSTELSTLDPTIAENPTLVSRDAGNSDRMLILSREQNLYIASPQLIQYPITIVGILIGLGLVLRCRLDRSARFLFVTTIVPLLLIYTPGIASTLGSFISYDTFWRFVWLLPTALAIGWGFDFLTRWISTRPAIYRHAIPALGSASVILIAVWGLGLARDVAASVYLVHSINDGANRYRQNQAVSNYIANLAGDGETILAPVFPSQMNRTIFAIAPDVQVVSWHRNSDVELHDRVTRFYDHSQMDPADVDLLTEQRVDYIVIPHDAPLVTFLSASKFELVGSIDNIDVYRATADLGYIYFEPMYVQYDYDALAKQIIAESGSGATVVIDQPGPDKEGNWQAVQQSVQRFFNDNYASGPRLIPLVNGTTRETFVELLHNHNPLYAIFWGEGMQDPSRAVERNLNANALVAGVNTYGRLRLVRYEPFPEPVVNADSGARFGNSIALNAFSLTADNLMAGGYLGVRLIWQTDSQVSLRYKVFLHLIGPDGTVVAQHDGEPNGNLDPTDTWSPGKVIIDNHMLVLPSDNRPGVYQLFVGLYTDDGGRLPVIQNTGETGDKVLLFEFTTK